MDVNNRFEFLNTEKNASFLQEFEAQQVARTFRIELVDVQIIFKLGSHFFRNLFYYNLNFSLNQLKTLFLTVQNIPSFFLSCHCQIDK